MTTLSGVLAGVRCTMGSGLATLFVADPATKQITGQAHIESGFGLRQLAAHRGRDLGVGRPITLFVDDLGLVAGVEEVEE
jgi:hypothetical protein